MPARVSGKTVAAAEAPSQAEPAAAATPTTTLPPRPTPVKKKASAAKGLMKLKPKGGYRTLSQNLKDYFTIAVILVLTALLGRSMQEGAGEHGEHEEEPHAAHAEAAVADEAVRTAEAIVAKLDGKGGPGGADDGGGAE